VYKMRQQKVSEQQMLHMYRSGRRRGAAMHLNKESEKYRPSPVARSEGHAPVNACSAKGLQQSFLKSYAQRESRKFATTWAAMPRATVMLPPRTRHTQSHRRDTL